MDCRFVEICEIRKSCETRQSNRKHLEIRRLQVFQVLKCLKSVVEVNKSKLRRFNENKLKIFAFPINIKTGR